MSSQESVFLLEEDLHQVSFNSRVSYHSCYGLQGGTDCCPSLTGSDSCWAGYYWWRSNQRLSDHRLSCNHHFLTMAYLSPDCLNSLLCEQLWLFAAAGGKSCNSRSAWLLLSYSTDEVELGCFILRLVDYCSSYNLMVWCSIVYQLSSILWFLAFGWSIFFCRLPCGGCQAFVEAEKMEAYCFREKH